MNTRLLGVGLLLVGLAGWSAYAPTVTPEAAPKAPAAPKCPFVGHVVVVTGANCPPCDRLKKELGSPAFAGLDVRYVDAGTREGRRYRASSTPTSIAYPAGGTPFRKEGFMTADEFSAWLCSRRGAVEAVGATVAGPKHADGTELSCDLPAEQHQRNTGGSDGAGLCVFASMRHSGRWQNDPLFTELFDWMRRHPGGGYPEKVTAMLGQCAKEKGFVVPQYLQVESNDLEILKTACRTGRMPGVTYGRSPTGRYGGQSISHMVSLVHADDRWFVVLDNNYPGGDQYEWMTPEEFRRAYAATSGKGWCVVLLTPPPPPPPRN